MVLVKRLYDDTPSGRVSEFVEIGSNELLPHELGGESNRASEASRTEHLEEPYPPASAGSGVSFSPRSGSFASFSAPVTPRATSFPPPPVSFCKLRTARWIFEAVGRRRDERERLTRPRLLIHIFGLDL